MKRFPRCFRLFVVVLFLILAVFSQESYTQDTLNIQQLDMRYTWGNVTSIHAYQDFVYLVASRSGIIILDATNIDNITEIGRIRMDAESKKVYLYNNRLYIYDNHDILIYNISDPYLPVYEFTDHFDIQSMTRTVLGVEEGYAYVLGVYYGDQYYLETYSIDSSGYIDLINQYTFYCPDAARVLAYGIMINGIIYVEGNVDVWGYYDYEYDHSFITKYLVIGGSITMAYSNNFDQSFGSTIKVDNDRIYVLAGYGVNSDTYVFYDNSNDNSISYITTYNEYVMNKLTAVENNYLYYRRDSSMIIYDINEITNPVIVDSIVLMNRTDITKYTRIEEGLLWLAESGIEVFDQINNEEVEYIEFICNNRSSSYADIVNMSDYYVLLQVNKGIEIVEICDNEIEVIVSYNYEKARYIATDDNYLYIVVSDQGYPVFNSAKVITLDLTDVSSPDTIAITELGDIGVTYFKVHDNYAIINAHDYAEIYEIDDGVLNSSRSILSFVDNYIQNTLWYDDILYIITSNGFIMLDIFDIENIIYIDNPYYLSMGNVIEIESSYLYTIRRGDLIVVPVVERSLGDPVSITDLETLWMNHIGPTHMKKIQINHNDYLIVSSFAGRHPNATTFTGLINITDLENPYWAGYAEMVNAPAGVQYRSENNQIIILERYQCTLNSLTGEL